MGIDCWWIYLLFFFFFVLGKRCFKYGSITNAKSFKNSNGQDCTKKRVNTGSVCTLICEDNTSLVGDATLTCIEDTHEHDTVGEWDGTLGVCQWTKPMNAYTW